MEPLKVRMWLDDVRPKPEDTCGVKWLWYTTVDTMIADLKRYINWGVRCTPSNLNTLA